MIPLVCRKKDRRRSGPLRGPRKSAAPPLRRTKIRPQRRGIPVAAAVAVPLAVDVAAAGQEVLKDPAPKKMSPRRKIPLTQAVVEVERL